MLILLGEKISFLNLVFDEEIFLFPNGDGEKYCLLFIRLLLAEKKLIYIQTVKTCFNYTLRKNIYLIVNYYMKSEIKILELCEDDEENEDLEEDDNESDSNNKNAYLSNDPKVIKKKKEINIQQNEIENFEKHVLEEHNHFSEYFQEKLKNLDENLNKNINLNTANIKQIKQHKKNLGQFFL